MIRNKIKICLVNLLKENSFCKVTMKLIRLLYKNKLDRSNSNHHNNKFSNKKY